MKELELHQTQKISLEILKLIDKICVEQNLRYSLIYGTLIGAIRHQGFIPWDDDIDIMMPRQDHDKLVAYLMKNKENYAHLEVFNPATNKDYPYMITRISDNRYVIDTQNEKDCGMGVFIDIYPFDGLGGEREEALEFGGRGDRLSSFCFLATRERYTWDALNSTMKNIARFPLFFIAKCFGKNYYQKKLSALVGVKDYDQSNYVGCVVWLSGGEKDIFLREWFDELITMPFEDGCFKIPKEYDKILRHIYGEYMVMPPEKERVAHHYYKVYEK